MIKITADFQSSQNYLMEFLLLDVADLFFQSSYRIFWLTVKNHVVEKTGPSYGPDLQWAYPLIAIQFSHCISGQVSTSYIYVCTVTKVFNRGSYLLSYILNSWLSHHFLSNTLKYLINEYTRLTI